MAFECASAARDCAGGLDLRHLILISGPTPDDLSRAVLFEANAESFSRALVANFGAIPTVFTQFIAAHDAHTVTSILRLGVEGDSSSQYL